jgi:hypothetical protein
MSEKNYVLQEDENLKEKYCEECEEKLVEFYCN